MSVESLQFVEMVREAASVKADPHIHPSTIKYYYCVVCGSEREHKIEEMGLDEVWRCCTCGIGKVFRVR